LATIMLVTVINSAGPSFLSLVNYQVPLWAVVFGVVLLGETLPAQFIWALGLILIGVAISQFKWNRKA
jgi:drug/metabolite transporter (DMT)-like permease